MTERTKNLLEELAPFALLVLVILFFTLLVGPSFVGLFNLRMVLVQSVVVMIAAAGATMVIINGGIDLSVGSLLALTTVVVALIDRELLAAGWSAFPAGGLAVITGILVSMLCGLFNGLSIALLRVSPFITTLGTLWIFRGIALWLSGNATVETGSRDMAWLMEITPVYDWLIVSPGVWFGVLVIGMTFILLTWTAFGRYVYAIGSNEATARLSGIRVERHKILIYTLAGMMAGIAGVMLFSYQNQGDPTAAFGKELYVIAAVVIGGASLSGGRGTVLGSFVGALFIQFLEQGLIHTRVDDHFQKMIIGAFLILAIALDRYRQCKVDGD
jgi:ribose transport system permease protein